jgi:ribonuclease Z
MRLVFFGAAGAVPSPSDGNVSFALQAGDRTVLMDASGNPVQSLLRAGLDPLELDALLLTHAHTDHIYGLPSLIHALWLMKRHKPLRVLANPSTAEKARQLLSLMGLLTKEGLFELRWSGRNQKRVVLDRSLVISLFPVTHSVPTSGALIQAAEASLAYSADTAPAESVVKRAQGCRALIHEASGVSTREEPLNAAGHSSARQAADAAARSGVPTLFLCHFDYCGDPRARERARREACQVFKGSIICPDPYRWYEIRGD